ncbi:MAG: IS200/IS605 family transposase [Deltaproteobacteria bacterium]|nr:IS200/IS605 family transposase [Deltaproteobacteria bacterium]|tara:strand:- start:46 stop:531 length:486 start_codon:yes stop_codon:yes gene_type:complete
MKKEYEWRTGRSCIYELQYHLVFVTKYRRGVFTAEHLQRLEEVFRQTCEQMEGELLEFSGESEHVHLLVSLPPKRAVSNVVGKLKGKSSYVLRKEFGEELKEKLWGKHLWSPSYCVVSCGGAPLEVIKKYIEEQQKPPGKISVERSRRVIQQHKQKQKVAH